MISFERDSHRFNFRVAAVILDRRAEGGRVLLHRAEHEPFWSLPGGRLELGECSADGVARELAEEIGVAARVERPLWLVENFFTHEGCRSHELGIYYLVTLPDNPEIHAKNAPFPGHEEGCVLVYQWHPIARLAELDIRPTFLGEAISRLAASDDDSDNDAPDGMEPRMLRHVIHHDLRPD